MFRISRSAFMLVLIPMAFVACVPARKYEETKLRADSMQAEVDAAKANALAAQTSTAELSAQVADYSKRNAELERDTTVLGTSLRKMNVQYDKINKLNDELLG